MSKKTTLILFYGTIMLMSIGVIFLSRYLHRQNEDSSQMPGVATMVINTGKTQTKYWFPIAKDLTGINQVGKRVKLSDLKGKVWLVANFFAVCPMCAQRNGAELTKIYQAFKDDPDFHMVCITVDPDNDNVEKLKAYGEALNADPANWWFINAGSQADTHRYLEEELKYFSIRERRDPVDIQANGRFAHDLGFILVDADFHVIGKWPLSDARSPQAVKRDPSLYDRLKKELMQRIKAELDKPNENE